MGSFVAATFNVLHGRTVAGAVDVALLARSCADLGADVLALQEVDQRVRRSGRADLAAIAAEAVGASHVFGPAVRMGWRGRYGNALLARGDVRDVTVLPLPRRRDEPRAALLASVEAGGGLVSVAATHLSIHEDESAPQLEAVIDALCARPHPRLLLGDLNRRPDQLDAVMRAGLELADPTVPSFPVHAPRIRIDHVAADGLRIDDVDVVTTPSSDHCAVVARLWRPD